MLIFALAVFTVVAIMGVGMACDVAKGCPTSSQFARTHGGFALLGSGLVIWEATQGDERLFINIGMAVVIIVLGVLMSHRRSKGLPVKGLAALHGLLAVACYGILVYLPW